jgi:hypothetical protein
MKQMKRAVRRYHCARLKRLRAFHRGRDLRTELRELGRVVNTLTPCSFWLCGNPHRHDGEITRAERIALEWERLGRAELDRLP